MGDYAVLGGQVGTVGHIEIGQAAQIGAKSGVSKNVPPGEVWFGYPATPMKQTKEQLARVALLPRLFERVKRLEQNARESEKSSSPTT
jgi:UDP-3-O-[3-hydroxymyristoyl] glucosamine N-acyltransferase